jgi:hypothetical protein
MVMGRWVADRVVKVMCTEQTQEKKTYTYILKSSNFKKNFKMDEEFNEWLRQQVKETGGVMLGDNACLVEEFLKSMVSGEQKYWLYRYCHPSVFKEESSTPIVTFHGDPYCSTENREVWVRDDDYLTDEERSYDCEEAWYEQYAEAEAEAGARAMEKGNGERP